MPWYAWVTVGLAIAVLAYWQLILAEGAYLGRRVVCWLYDISAGSYESIKGFEPIYEQAFLGEPLAVALAGRPRPLVLDVAAGTGRLPRALAEAGAADHTLIVQLDASRRMLLQGRAILDEAQLGEISPPVHADALVLPFADATFDAVVSLEALEFMPDADQALVEMVRVLKPGGPLFITNRKGSARWYMPGRARTAERVIAKLNELGIVEARARAWQVDYELIIGIKDGSPN